MSKSVNLQAVSTYIAVSAPGQLEVLRDLCRAAANRLGVSVKKAKALPEPQAVKEATLKVHGFKGWCESIDKTDVDGKADLATVLAALEAKLG
jgi:hypothetical protein